MRIRTDGDKAHREDVIEGAASFYGCNKTRAVVLACNDVPELADAVVDVLDRDDLTREQREEIAERFDQCRGIDVAVTTEVEVAPDG